MGIVFDIVRTIRHIRAESKIPPSELRDIILTIPSGIHAGISANSRIIA